MLCYLHRNNICNLSCVAKQMPCYLCRILWQNYIFLMHLTKKNLCVLPIFWRKACSNWFSFFGQCLVEIEKQVFEVQVLKKEYLQVAIVFEHAFHLRKSWKFCEWILLFHLKYPSFQLQIPYFKLKLNNGQNGKTNILWN